MEFICVREVLFYQVNESLTNIRFDICRITWIILYYFGLSSFIVIYFVLMYNSTSPKIHFFLKHHCKLVYFFQKSLHLMTNQIIICLSITLVVLLLLVDGLNSCLCKLMDYLTFCMADRYLFTNQKLHQDS